MYKKLFLKTLLLFICFVGGGAAFADTKTETFESASSGTNYQSTVTVSTSSSSCGIGWSIYYGCVSKTNAISGNQSAQMRLYNNKTIGYLKTTTAIDGLSKVSFKIKSSNASVKYNVLSSTDGESWTTIASNVSTSTSVETKEYDITLGHKYFQIAVASGFPSSSNYQLFVDDVIFTYSTSVAVTGVSLNETFSTLKVGETLDLTATVSPSDATDKSVTWTSSDSNVASVSNGTVTANATGNATITVTTTDGSKTATCAVTVIAADAVTPPTFSLSDGASVELGSTVTITAEEDHTLKYQIGDGEKTSVASNTKELTLNDLGDVTISAWSVDGEAHESDAASIDLIVTKHPITLSFAPTSVSVARGNTIDAPALSGNMGSGTVTYSSDDETIATVNSSTGVVTGVAVGSATITATVAESTYYLGNTQTFTVTVTKPYHTATFFVNGNTTEGSFQENAPITFPSDPEDINGMTFVGWYTTPYTNAVAPEYVNTATETMGENDVTFYAVFAEKIGEDLGWTATSLAEIESSEDFVFTDSKNHAMRNDGTSASPKSVTITLTNGVITSEVTANMKWRVTGNAIDGYIFYKSGDSAYLYCNTTANSGSNDNIRVGDGSRKLWIFNDSGYLITNDKNVTRYLSYYGSNSDFRSYINTSNNPIVPTFYKYVGATYSNFCTTVSALPRPVITMDNVEMTWGDTGKKVAPSATVEDEAVDGTFTFTSSDNTKLTVASDGTITCNVPGTYTVTATITATEDYQAASANCTVTVNKKDITLAFANAEVDKLTTDGSHTQNATVTPAAYDGTIAYTLASNTCGASNSGSTVSFTTSGSVTVKANAPATDLYNAAEEVSYVLNVSKVPAATITALNISSVGAGTNGTLSATYTPAEDCDVTVTYTTSNALVLSIDGTSYEAESGGNVTVTVTVTPDDTDVYETVSREFDVTVTDTRTAPTFAFSASEVRANLDEKAQFEAPTLTNTSDGTLVFTSSDTDVATVNSTTGAVELLDVGTTTITAVVSGSATYQNAQASYTLTVYVPTYTFAKVTDASSLRAGDKLIFVNETAKVAMGEKKENNFGVTAITLNDGIATGVTNSPASFSPASFLTLEGTADAWYFNLNGQYLYAASSNSNQLKIEDEKDDNAKATISISTGNATITFQGTNTRNLLRYNSSSGLFSCYGSGQDAVQIYRMSELVTLPAGIYATRCYGQALNYSSTDITVYTAKVNTEKSTVSLNEVNSGKVPANAGVILYSETGGTITVPVAESASALENNDLVGITEETLVKKTDDDTYYNYILQREVVNEVNKYAFNIATDEGAMLAANRAYLHTTFLASDNNARLAIVFGNNDDEPSGIEHLHSTTVQGAVFNLNGQRVENPKKGGLYIVNGKKMVVRQ